ncbi:unnamed protein product [Rotaria magnacalcarata]
MIVHTSYNPDILNTNQNNCYHHVESPAIKHRRIAMASLVHSEPLQESVLLLVLLSVNHKVLGVLRGAQSIGFCLVIWVACGLLSIVGDIQNFQNGFAETTKNGFCIAIAFYSGFWAYEGWSSLNSVTEEWKNPKRNLWLSILLALPGVIVLYVLTNIS